MEYVDGNERRFGAEDLFFSTTDTKGVIRRTNRVFDSPGGRQSRFRWGFG